MEYVKIPIIEVDDEKDKAIDDYFADKKKKIREAQKIVDKWDDSNPDQEYYNWIMDKLEQESTIRYYRCGSCNGPVEAGFTCIWCGCADPVTKK